MSKSVLGRGLGSLLGSGESKKQTDASKKGVGLLLHGPAHAASPAGEPAAVVLPTPAEASPIKTVPTAGAIVPQKKQVERSQPVLSRPASAQQEAPATPGPVWSNPLVWLIGADVVFVALAGWIAIAGHSPVRWIGVLVLMLLAGSIGFIGYYIPTSGPAVESKPEPKDNRKIRVHFVDELPKKRK